MSHVQHQCHAETRFMNAKGVKANLASWDGKGFLASKTSHIAGLDISTYRMTGSPLENDDSEPYRVDWFRNERVVVDYGGFETFNGPFVCTCVFCVGFH